MGSIRIARYCRQAAGSSGWRVRRNALTRQQLRCVIYLGVALGGLLLGLSSCGQFTSQQGVDNRWRDPNAVQFQVGRTTQSDVLETLGPPSQIISLNDGVVFYYLREYKSGEAKIFIVYNEAHLDVLYDRAIFFFDRDGRLTHHAYSAEEAPR